MQSIGRTNTVTATYMNALLSAAKYRVVFEAGFVDILLYFWQTLCSELVVEVPSEILRSCPFRVPSSTRTGYQTH